MKTPVAVVVVGQEGVVGDDGVGLVPEVLVAAEDEVGQIPQPLGHCSWHTGGYFTNLPPQIGFHHLHLLPDLHPELLHQDVTGLPLDGRKEQEGQE